MNPTTIATSIDTLHRCSYHEQLAVARSSHSQALCLRKSASQCVCLCTSNIETMSHCQTTYVRLKFLAKNHFNPNCEFVRPATLARAASRRAISSFSFSEISFCLNDTHIQNIISECIYNGGSNQVEITDAMTKHNNTILLTVEHIINGNALCTKILPFSTSVPSTATLS